MIEKVPDVEKEEILFSLELNDDYISGLKFSENGELLAYSLSEMIYIYSMNENEVVQTFKIKHMKQREWMYFKQTAFGKMLDG